MDDDVWTLQQIKEAGYYLWAACHPDHTRAHIFMLDIDALIKTFGVDFNVVGTRLSRAVYCPTCGRIGDARVGVGSYRAARMEPYRVRTIADGYYVAPGAVPPAPDKVVPIEEATRAALELTSQRRAVGNSHQLREDARVKAAIAKAKAAKERRRRNNPYDFS